MKTYARPGQQAGQTTAACHCRTCVLVHDAAEADGRVSKVGSCGESPGRAVGFEGVTTEPGPLVPGMHVLLGPGVNHDVVSGRAATAHQQRHRSLVVGNVDLQEVHFQGRQTLSYIHRPDTRPRSRRARLGRQTGLATLSANPVKSRIAPL